MIARVYANRIRRPGKFEQAVLKPDFMPNTTITPYAKLTGGILSAKGN
jgi:hypothetical protein